MPSRISLAILFTLFVALPTRFLQADENLDQRIAIEKALRNANDYYIANFPLGTAVWNRGAYHAGNFRAWNVLRIPAYLDEAVAWAVANNWTIGPEAGGGADADSMTCGQTYIDLYRVDPQPVRIASIQAKLDSLKASSTSADDWWWIDAFFMAGPTFASMGTLKSDSSYYDQLMTMYSYMKNSSPGWGLFSAQYGLWYRDNTAKSHTGANTPEFWGRGNGWAIAACARILEQLPAGDFRRGEFATMIQTMAAALLPLQGSDGFWRSNLLSPDQYSNPETSCTAFFTYGIAYGINEGLLDPTIYRPVVMKAWNGMIATALQANGKLGYVQAIGAAPGAATASSDQDYGYGAFMLAGCEILRMLGGPASVAAITGADARLVDTDGNYVEPVTLDASRSVVRNGSIVSYSWWLGAIYLGSGEHLPVEFPYGTYEVTLKALNTDGIIYTDTQSITVVSPSEVTVTASGYQDPNLPVNTLDGLFDTRWSQDSGNGGTQYIQFTLPETISLGQVDIAFYSGNTRRSYFDIRVSSTGSSWNANTTRVFDGRSTSTSGGSSGTTNAFETFNFTARSAKYVRIYGYGNAVNTYISLTEVKFPLPTLTDDADSDSNGLPDSWEIRHYGATGQSPLAKTSDGSTTVASAYTSGADPIAPHVPEILQVVFDPASNGGKVRFTPRAAFGAGYVGKVRKYRILTSPTLDAVSWQPLPGYESISADNVLREIPISVNGPARFYRAEVWLE